MLWRVLRGSFRHQWRRLGVATVAVVLAAGLISTLANLSFHVPDRTGRELRAYGPNIVLLPAGAVSSGTASILWGGVESAGIRESELAALGEVEQVIDFVPYLYLVATVETQPVVVAGTWFERARSVSPWWRVVGQWPRRAGESLVGAGVARALGLKVGDPVLLEYGDSTRKLTVAGVIETGGAEESQILVRLSVAQILSGRPGEVGLVQVSALTGERPVEKTAAAIRARLPNVEARPVQQFARAELDILNRVRRLMLLVAVLVLAVAALTAGSTMLTVVLERRSEIGLMKGLGASGRWVATLFLAEGLGMGFVGGLLGYAGGLGMAAFIGRRVFRAQLSPDPAGFLVTLAVAVGTVLLASLWPVRRALAVDAALTLRGE